ncbi:MAG: tryptophan-rich sensory protein [Candidatus Bathyarchaeota archaeon]|nr:tryptophan-rich sensory protein [Candidatus Bathyarchaeota archaeon]
MAALTSEVLKWANILAFLLTLIVNGLAGSTTIIGGKNTAQISDANPTLITPAGYVFSIWGVIYILLGVFVVLQALPSEKGKSYQKRIGWLFVLSNVFNIAWLFLWQFEQLIPSLALMFLLLTTLITIYLRLDVGKSTVSLRERLAIHLPFSVYLGWITIASIANVAVALVSVNWNGFGINAEIWATLIIIIALLITLFVIATRKDIAYGLVIIWALLGIATKQSENLNIAITAEISAVVVTVALSVVILSAILKRR